MPDQNPAEVPALTAPIMKNPVVKLTKTGLFKDKEDGLTVPEMAAKYNLTTHIMRKALKVAGVATRAKSKAKFEIVDEIDNNLEA